MSNESDFNKLGYVKNYVLPALFVFLIPNFSKEKKGQETLKLSSFLGNSDEIVENFNQYYTRYLAAKQYQDDKIPLDI